jgi:hypothetical protein
MAEQLLYRCSSYSGDGANCVESGPHGAGVSVRDSKDPAGPTIECTHSGWARFVRETVHGMAHDNGEVVVTTEEAVLTYSGTVGTKVTCWHLHAVDSDVVLHFTAGEREAFILGARDGEFTYPQPPPVLAAVN